MKKDFKSGNKCLYCLRFDEKEKLCLLAVNQ